MEKQTVDVPDIMQMSGLGRSKIYELDREGKIPGRVENVGRRKLWGRAKVLKWLAGGSDGPEGD